MVTCKEIVDHRPLVDFDQITITERATGVTGVTFTFNVMSVVAVDIMPTDVPTAHLNQML